MRAVGIRHWNAIRNCGDSISSYIVKDVLNWEPVLVGRNVDHALCVGSIFYMANQKSYIWGSGIIDSSKDFDVNPERVMALRGKQTVSYLQKRGIKIKDVPLGDPGVLIRHIPEVKAWQQKQREFGSRYKAAFIPHWSQMGHWFYSRYADSTEFTVVDMRDDGLTPIRQIIESDVVIAQSLHGLIFAEALGKPTVWLAKRDDDLWNYKFNDWYTNVRNAPRRAMMIDGFDERTALKAAEVRELMIDEQAMIAAFPGEQAQTQIKPGFVDFRTARDASPMIIAETDLLPDCSKKIADMLETEAAAFYKTLQRKLSHLYQNWSERPYTLFVRPGSQLPYNIVSLMRLYLEENSRASMVSAIPSKVASEVFGSEAMSDWKGLKVASKDALVGNAIMVRPTSNGHFTDDNASLVF